MHLHVMVILFTEWFSRWADAEFRSTAKTPFQQGAEVANGVEPVLTATTVVLIHYKNLWVWIKVIEGFSNKNTFMPILIQQENFARSKNGIRPISQVLLTWFPFLRQPKLFDCDRLHPVRLVSSLTGPFWSILPCIPRFRLFQSVESPACWNRP